MTVSSLLFGFLAATANPSLQVPGQGLSGEGAKLFQQVVSNPTGTNGYEEYVEAAAILLSPNYRELQIFESWVNWPDRFRHRDSQGRPVMPTSDPLDKAGRETSVVAPPNLSLDSSLLQVQQEFVRRFGGALQIVERGNRKRVFNPRQEMGLETLLPELAHFKELAKLFSRKAEADFASGSSAAGSQALIEGLQFSSNLSDSSIIHSLVGIANQSILLASFEKVLGRLSLPDAQAVTKTCDQLLRRPPTASRAILAELRTAERLLDEVLAKPSLIDYTVGEDAGEGLAEQIGRLDGSRKSAVRDRARELLRAKQREFADTLTRPEKSWHRSSFAEFPVSRDEASWRDSLAGAIVNRLTPNFAQILESQARSRTQLRILLASARVMEYKWRNGRLPGRLEDAAPSASIYDSGSDAPLRYEVLTPWAFRIQSDGWGKTGPIGLRYRRPSPAEPSEPAGPPPPL